MHTLGATLSLRPRVCGGALYRYCWVRSGGNAIRKAHVRAVVYGRVQGVYFRAFVQSEAEGLGLTGYVRNLPSGNAVQVHAEGDEEKLHHLLARLKVGPSRAVVSRLDIQWSEYTGECAEFEIKY